jgi:fructokinase
VSDHALVVGEALVDVMVTPQGTAEERPGGSPANVALGLGRLGRTVELLTWIGLDDYGRMVRDHLEESGVTLVRGSESALHTSVATARLDDSGSAHYDFDLTWAVAPQPAVSRNPLVLHTGSIATVLAPGAASVRSLVERQRASATITYDPNCRPALMGNPVTASALVDSMVVLADVVKVSDEDLNWLNPDLTLVQHARRYLEMGPSIVVITRGGQGASAYLPDGRRLDVTAPQVQVADTVGAGDSFMGGLIDGLWQAGLLGAANREVLGAINNETLTSILTRCIGIAAITVSRVGANPPTKAELGE